MAPTKESQSQPINPPSSILSATFLQTLLPSKTSSKTLFKMTEQTFHTTRQDLRKEESRIARQHGGKVPADSDVSQMKSIIDKNTDKSKQIEQVKANLPLPDEPPCASDWNSSDQRTVNVGSGRVEGPISGDNDTALRGPATAGSSARIDGTPIGRGPRSTKVTTDPRATQQPISEPAGPVANDSLAAESVRSGGAFSENRGAEPVGVSGNQSTLKNTDTSGATTLPSAPSSAFREDQQRQDKYPEALGGQAHFPGAHGTAYAGGSTAAKQEMGINKGEYAASEHLPSQAAASGSSQYKGGQAPSYINDVTDGYQGQKPKGQNLHAGDFPADSNNASFNSEIGSKMDPGRAAENKFQRKNAESALDVGGPRQKGVDSQNLYDSLKSDQRA
ncbi:hypothetical protein F1880_006334 [Penicillium rolfsii]|nr:hypothetical protein F1880_006334 [Penicillium rolfsii]